MCFCLESIWRQVWWWQKSRWRGGGPDPAESCRVSPSSSVGPERRNGSCPPAETDSREPHALQRDRWQVHSQVKTDPRTNETNSTKVWWRYQSLCWTSSTAAARCLQASELLQTKQKKDIKRAAVWLYQWCFSKYCLKRCFLTSKCKILDKNKEFNWYEGFTIANNIYNTLLFISTQLKTQMYDI